MRKWKTKDYPVGRVSGLFLDTFLENFPGDEIGNPPADYGEGRTCPGCGCFISCYNPDDICCSCTRNLFDFNKPVNAKLIAFLWARHKKVYREWVASRAVMHEQQRMIDRGKLCIPV